MELLTPSSWLFLPTTIPACFERELTYVTIAQINIPLVQGGNVREIKIPVPDNFHGDVQPTNRIMRI